MDREPLSGQGLGGLSSQGRAALVVRDPARPDGGGVGVHMWLSRYKDRTCPWVGLGWIVLVANIIALMLFMTMTL
jgi:hypothetical protein